MSLKPQLIELIAAQIEDLRALSPYAMASMAEYGKVGGYAPAYLELKRDVFGCFQLCSRLFPGVPVQSPDDLPPLAPNRMMSEIFFEDERGALVGALRRLASALGQISDGAYIEQERRMPPEAREALDWLLDRAGIDPEVPRGVGTAPSRGQDVFVSSRFPRRLGDQIADVLLSAGLNPIRAGGAPVEEVVSGCVGGVFGVLVDPNEGLSARRDDARGLDRAFMENLAEISSAERRLRRNLVIVTGAHAIERLPNELREKPLFQVKSSVMDSQELSRFSTFAARTPWLRPAAPLI